MLTRGRRRPFDCGHKGYGQFCHRCEQAAALAVRAKSETDKEKAAKFRQDSERLFALPEAAA